MGLCMFDLRVKKDYSVYENMRNPFFLKKYYKFKTIDLIKGNEIYGSSPPDLFIGRIGYPDVFIGPMVPPTLGDTEIMGTPEMWVGKSIPEIVELRSSLVRGMYRTKVTNVDRGKTEEAVKEIALAEKFTSIDLMLKHKPSLKMSFSENSQPFGPSAPLERMTIGNIKADQKVEDAYLDTSMTATQAIIELYDKGTLVSKIQKALAAGLLGRGKARRFVPTRWSITATDDTLSKQKLKTLKQLGTIDSVKVYEKVALDNRWVIMMMPGQWEYESMEAWYPNTTWNMNSKEIDMGVSYEPFEGRKTYAEIGGCYYAARLAVSELLERKQAQAKVIILREVHSGYIMPVGVWNVREHVREALRCAPLEFPDLQSAFKHISSRLEIPLATWIANSTLLKKQMYQRRLVQAL